MKVLHTSDWHLGHSLRDWGREEEHGEFLRWLLDTIAAEDIDALIVAGDLFDTSNPSAASQKQFYTFLAQLRERHPQTGIVLVGGNHDSAARLDAPEPLLTSLRIHVVGSLPYKDYQERSLINLDLDRLIVPLKNRHGVVEAWLAAVPYLREADLPMVEEEDDFLIASTRALYGFLTTEMERRRSPDQALLATGHCFVQGGSLSPNSERKIQAGNQIAIPTDVFPESLAYVALGHLHRPQTGGRENIHYSGAPFAFSLDEADYGHRVQVVELADGSMNRHSIPIPCITEILIEPSKTGAFSIDEAERWIEKQPRLLEGEPDWKRPFLELRILNARRQPALWERLTRMLRDRRPRLVKLTDVRPDGETEREESTVQLSELEPIEVFQRRWRQVYKQEPMPADVLSAFHRLLEDAQRGES